eukprot:CAMPEP_0117468086 /NCGR_PEP_ID=MMETSP0784-20121206/5993_1 /TAXON_ID=39447 /ORGANISM="" /LENGTH=40 /DNA_ID= /DNA_START= /DNA_END= /DNA_ORIENTATION=
MEASALHKYAMAITTVHAATAKNGLAASQSHATSDEVTTG